MFGTYKQYDSRWGKKNYNGSSNYAQAACGPTSCANILYAIDSSITPVTTGTYMQKNGFAIRNNGTAWSGIPSCLKAFGAENVQSVDVSTSMTKVWELMKNGYVGVFLFRDGTRSNITWTTSGHYLAVTGYKVEGGKHYLRMVDSGGRDHDGWYCYETQMKGLIPKVWLCTVTPKTGSKYTGTLTLQTVKIGHAKGGEGGKHTGGKAGDQTGGEVGINKWSYGKAGKYNHWTHVYRAKSEETRLKIGNDMIWTCKNNKIGYDAKKPDRFTFHDEAKKVGWDARKITKKCETTCGQTVGVCLEYGGQTMPRYVSNLTVINSLNKATSKFTLYQSSDYTSKSNKLEKGDVLVSKGHHTAIVVQGASLRKGDNSEEVKNLQKFLKWYGLNVATDGDFGNATEKAVIKFQEDNGLLVDGVVGSATIKKMKEYMK